MKKRELTKIVEKTLGRKVQLLNRLVKNKAGEWCQHYVSVHGEYQATYKIPQSPLYGEKYNDNGSLWYADDKDEIIEALRNDGFIVHDTLGNKYEILIEVSKYWIYDENKGCDVVGYDFEKSENTFLSKELRYHNTKDFKIVNS